MTNGRHGNAARRRDCDEETTAVLKHGAATCAGRAQSTTKGTAYSPRQAR
jgi:hypothetical protein